MQSMVLSLDSIFEVYAFVSPPPASVFRRFVLQSVFHTSTWYNTLTSVRPCAARAAQAVSDSRKLSTRAPPHSPKGLCRTNPFLACPSDPQVLHRASPVAHEAPPYATPREIRQPASLSRPRANRARVREKAACAELARRGRRTRRRSRREPSTAAAPDCKKRKICP